MGGGFKRLAVDAEWLANTNNAETLLAKMDTKKYYGEEQRENMLAAQTKGSILTANDKEGSKTHKPNLNLSRRVERT